MKNLLFLSAQPDDYFFTWQIELQLFNFRKLGIQSENIHVLIGYDPKRGLRHYVNELIDRNKHLAKFYVYPDRRDRPAYLSSLRPHIIQQHFAANEWLSSNAVFYHDSDIIFRELPDFSQLLKEDCWYVSDTRSYLDSRYVIGAANSDTLSKMCEVVGISRAAVVENDAGCGGAQYILKNVSPQFWGKIEADAEAIYKLLIKNNLRQGDSLLRAGRRFSEYNGIQAWCADMWALFYNALHDGREVRISTELDFCWATDDISHWYEKKILHYTGTLTKEDDTYFQKGRYVNFSPYQDAALNKISRESSSYSLFELIKEFNLSRECEKTDLTDVSFLIPARIDSPSRLRNLLIIVQYLTKYFSTHILIIESDIEAQIPVENLPPSVVYEYIHDEDQLFHRTRINNLLIKKASTPTVVLCDIDAVVPVEQIIQAVELLRSHNADIVLPYDGCFISVDNLFKLVFEKILDPEIFCLNQNKFTVSTRRSWGGCIFLSKQAYMNAGMENEYFGSWGPEDMERVKRMKNFGYIVERIDGVLFHLPHERKLNSHYADPETKIRYMEEFLKVCNLRRKDLKQYISTWQWTI